MLEIDKGYGEEAEDKAEGENDDVADPCFKRGLAAEEAFGFCSTFVLEEAEVVAVGSSSASKGGCRVLGNVKCACHGWKEEMHELQTRGLVAVGGGGLRWRSGVYIWGMDTGEEDIESGMYEEREHGEDKGFGKGELNGGLISRQLR